jgi:hypothetical protein
LGGGASKTAGAAISYFGAGLDYTTSSKSSKGAGSGLHGLLLYTEGLGCSI